MALRVRKNKRAIPPMCPVDQGMRLLGGAWAPHVIWYLSAEPRRFGELRRDIPAISARVLSRRLRDLQAKGVVTRTPLDTSPPSAEYALTDLGQMLVPAIAAIVDAAIKLGLADRPPPAKRSVAGTGRVVDRATAPTASSVRPRRSA